MTCSYSLINLSTPLCQKDVDGLLLCNGDAVGTLSARENCGRLAIYIPIIRQSSGPSINTCEKVCTMEIVW